MDKTSWTYRTYKWSSCGSNLNVLAHTLACQKVNWQEKENWLKTLQGYISLKYPLQSQKDFFQDSQLGKISEIALMKTDKLH